MIKKPYTLYSTSCNGIDSNKPVFGERLRKYAEKMENMMMSRKR